MIRYPLIAITVSLTIIQYFNEYDNIATSLTPVILKLNIITGSTLILTFLISKLFDYLFYMKTPEYDDSRPIAGANAIADIISFSISVALIAYFLP